MRAPYITIVAYVISFIAAPVLTALEPPDYSKSIVGCWLGPRKFAVYHADGTWGLKRNEDAPEDKKGRRYRVEGDKLILTYPGDGNKTESVTYKIISCSKHDLVLELEGQKEEFERYSDDCQNEA